MSEANGPDKSLLRWQEDELNEAEAKVLKAFRVGWKTDDGLVQVIDGRMTVVIPPEGSSAPEKPAEGHTADDWQDALLRAEFLRDLFLGNYGKFDPRLIEISRAWIEGRLNLDYCESLLPLAFSRCIFSDGIALRNATIPELQLIGCEVRKSRFTQGLIRSLHAQGAKVSSNVFLVDGFKADGEVNLYGANIGGRLSCYGGHFEKDLMAPNLKTGEDVFLREGFKSNGEVNLDGANIGRLLDCDGGHFEKGLSALSLKTGGHVSLGGDFKSNGLVGLDGANIGGLLDCTGGHFEEGLSALSLKTGEDVMLRKGFKSNGEVNLHGANIGGLLDCTGGHFEKGLSALSLKTGGHMVLRGGFKSNGEVNLHGANIGGSMALGGADATAILDNAEVHGVLAELENWPRRGSADGFRYQSIALARGWKPGWKWVRDMSQSSESRLAPKFAEKLMSVDQAYRRMSTNGAPARIGLAFSLILLAFSLVRLLMFISFWVIEELFHMLWSPEFSPQPYEQLMSVYRRMGHTNWARNVGFQLEKRRSKAFKGWQSLTWRPWYVILRWTIGYGYKPFRFFLWAAGLMTTGFLLFSSGHPDGIVSRYAPQSWQVVSRFAPQSWQEPAFLNKASAFLANEWIPSEGEALASESWEQNRKPPPDYLPFNPLVYSLEATFPVLNLGQLEKWHPSNRFLLGVRWACTLIGTLLLAILALFGAGVLGPRWRSGDEGG